MTPFLSASYRADEAVIYSAVWADKGAFTDKGPPLPAHRSGPVLGQQQQKKFRKSRWTG